MLTYEYELITEENKGYHVIRVFKDGEIFSVTSIPKKDDNKAEIELLKVTLLDGMKNDDVDPNALGQLISSVKSLKSE